MWFTAIANPEWAGRNRWNGPFQKFDPRLGMPWHIAPLAHSFYQVVPPDKYWATHPEYYSYRHGQGRMAGEAQLCLANDRQKTFDGVITFRGTGAKHIRTGLDG